MNYKAIRKELEKEQESLADQLSRVKRVIRELFGPGKSAKLKKRKKMSAKGRAAIARAQKARWAKIKAGKGK
jgi:hypothetical protein